MSSRVISPSGKMNTIKYSVMDTMDRAYEAAQAGKDIIYMHIGDPLLFDFKTPDHIVDAAYRAMKAGKTGYTDSSGIKEAIAAIEAESHRKGIKSIQDIFVTTGVSEAIDIAFSALVDIGDNILLPSPSYPLYISSLHRNGAAPNFYELDEDNNWQPDIDDIRSKINDKTRGIVVIYPNNPTGSLYSKETLQKIIALAEEHNLLIFSDEIYDKLLFDNEEHVSIAAMAPDLPVVTLCGLSKSYIAPGFRLGWAVISGRNSDVRDYCEAIAKFTRARLCANYPGQFAIKPALQGDHSHIADAVKKLEKRRDITVKMLNAIEGISCVSPNGAFYAFAKFEYDINDVDFVHKLIDETGVITLHGSGFGQKEGTRHFRIVFLAQEEKLRIGFERIADFSRQFI